MLRQSLRKRLFSSSGSPKVGTEKSRKRRRKQQLRRLLHQSLEDRRLLAVYTWDGGGDGTSFSDPHNWAIEGTLQPDTAPGINDDVVIDLDGEGTAFVVQLTGDQQVNSVSLNDDDAVLRVNRLASLTANTIDVTTGRLDVEGGNVTATSLTNTDRVTIRRTVNFDIDQIDNDNSFTIQNSTSSSLLLDGAITNSGSLELNPSGAQGGTLEVSGGIVNETGGSIQIGAIGGRTQTLRTSINNAGSVVFAAPNITFNQDNAAIVNTGQIEFAEGLRFATFDSNTRIQQISGHMQVDGDILLDNGTFDVDGGSVEITNRVLVENQGTIDVSGGSIVTETGVLFQNQTGTFNFSGGDITGARPVQLAGATDLNLSHDGSFHANTSGDTTLGGALSVGQSLTINAQASDLIVEPGVVIRGDVTFDNPSASAANASFLGWLHH